MNWKCDKKAPKKELVNECPFCDTKDNCQFIGTCKYQISEYTYKKRSIENVNC